MEDSEIIKKINEKASNITSKTSSVDINKLRDILNIKSTVQDIDDKTAEVIKNTNITIKQEIQDIKNVISTSIPVVKIKALALNIKNQIITKPIKPSIPNISQYNIYEKVRQLIDDVEQLKLWRKREADPNFINLFHNINNIVNNLENVILPQILNASNIAKTAQTKATEIFNMANQALVDAKNASDTAHNAYEKASEILSIATDAMDNSKNAIEFAKSFILKLQLAGEIMKLGLSDIAYATDSLQNTFRIEMVNTIENWNAFGLLLLNKANIIKEKLIELASTFISVAQNVSKPLIDMAGHISGAYSDTSKAWSEFKSGDALGAAEYLKHAVNDALRAAEDIKDSAQAIVGGFTALGNASTDTANSFNNFGISLQNGSIALANKTKDTMSNFRREMMQYGAVFKRVFDDIQTAFIEEYSNEAIANEVIKRTEEREKYLSFMGDLNEYERAISDCKEISFYVPIYQKNYEDAILAYDNKEAEINKIITDTRTLVGKYYPIDEALAFQEGMCSVTWDRRLGWKSAQPAPKVSANKNYPSNQTSVAMFPIINPASGKAVTLDMSYSANWNKYNLWDFVNGQGRYYRYIVCNKNTWLNKREKNITEAKLILDESINTKNNICSQVSVLKESFVQKWNMTPEEGDTLTFEQIINL